jgi:hypothetical protein
MKEQIFYPAFVMFSWISIMLFYLAYVRIQAVKGREIKFSQFKLQEGMPEKIQQVSNNVNNLFQVPLLFFIACLFLLILDKVNPLNLFLSWGFVLLRIIHSWVHISENDVNLRFFSFALGVIFLIIIYAGLFLDLIK